MNSNTPNLRLTGSEPGDEGAARIEAALDRLARAEADSAPAGFEDRIARAVMHGAGPAPLPMARSVRAPLVTPLRLAACLALTGTGLAVFVASRPAPAPPMAAFTAATLDDAAGELLAVAALHGDDESFSTQIESFLADTERVGQGFQSGPAPDAEPGQGAM